jgi:hypothetical protein
VISSKAMNIVYLVFGDNLNNYQQVYFSIIHSVYSKNNSDRIIYHEDASLFKSFGDKIEIIPINRNLINDWEGEYHFFGE